MTQLWFAPTRDLSSRSVLTVPLPKPIPKPMDLDDYQAMLAKRLVEQAQQEGIEHLDAYRLFQQEGMGLQKPKDWEDLEADLATVASLRESILRLSGVQFPLRSLPDWAVIDSEPELPQVAEMLQVLQPQQ